MTNLEWIHSLSTEELAELLVSEKHETTYTVFYDEDSYDDDYDDYDNDEYTSPDGKKFYFREDAVEYIKGWLGEENN